MNRLARLLVSAVSLAATGCGGQDPTRVGGVVRDSDSKPIAALFVTVRALDGTHSVSALTDDKGRFSLHPPAGDSLWFFVIDRGDTLATVRGARSARMDLRVVSQATQGAKRQPSSWWLSRLPDGEEKRRFILDCTGCHQFNETRVDRQGTPRSREQWAEDVRRMLGYAGADSKFPVIAAGRDPDRTAEWLASHLSSRDAGPARSDAPHASRPRFEVIEYDLPEPRDLPHDVAVTDSGTVLVTGMFTHVIYRVDPTSGRVAPVEIPVPNANPRAIELDETGDWWVLLGQPMRVARYAARTGKWDSWEIGLYGHSIALAEQGRSVWFNGHFTRDPEEMGRLDPQSGAVEKFALPKHPTLASHGGPVPYEQRLGPDGTVWMSELQGNRLLQLDPRTKNTRVHVLPERWSGPRRFDVDESGNLWIPGYSSGALWKLEAATGAFRKYPLPVADALPYVARVSERDGRIWIGTGAADAVFTFDPRSAAFETYPLPTRGATVRHLAIDDARGDVWLAYGASPALHPARIARIRANR